MRRQTKRHYGQDPGYYLICSEFCQEDGCGECSSLDEAVDRLGAYEDTGLMPEEIERSKMEIEAGCVKAIARTYGIDINRLRQLAAADRDGRVIVLPCREGTKVYKISWRLNGQHEIEERIFNLTYFDPAKYGKDYFLSREEAKMSLDGKNDG